MPKTLNVNDFTIPVYELDTKMSIERRVIAFMESTPDHCIVFNNHGNIFPYAFDYNHVEKYKVTTQSLFLILQHFNSFAEMWKQEREFIQQLDLPLKELAKLFIAFKGMTDVNQLLLLQYEIKGVTEIEISMDELELYSRLIEETRNELSKSVLSFKQEVEKKDSVLSSFDNIGEDIEDIVFYPHSKNYNLIVTCSEAVNQLILFDKLMLNDVVLYANCGEFYKMSAPEKLNEIDEKQIQELDESEKLTFYMHFSKNHYANVTCSLIFDRFASFDVEYRYDDKQKEIEFEKMIEWIIASFSFDFPLMEERHKDMGVGGYVVMKNIKCNPFILSDLILNESIFSYFMGINESLVSTKRKNTILLFTDGTLSKRPFYFNSKKTSKNDSNMRKFDLELGSFYCQFRVNIPSLDYFKRLSKILNKLFSVYLIISDKIIKYYNIFLPESIRNEPVINIDPSKYKRQKYDLKYIAPEVFIPGYGEKCQKRQPVILQTEEEADEFLEQNPERTIMKFPAFGEAKERIYVCAGDKAKHPGLIKNTLKNNALFPYIPCCFDQDQSLKKNFRDYFNKEKPENDLRVRKEYIITTMKNVQPDAFGNCLATIASLLNMRHPNSQFLRLGVNKSPNSFLECILYAKYEQFRHLSLSSRKEMSSSIRKKLSNLNLCFLRPFHKGYTDIDIQKYLAGDQGILDAKKMLRLLEVYFECKIYVFNHDGKSLFVTPEVEDRRYSVELTPSRPIILVYEGTQHQYELIVRWTGETEYIDEHSFPLNDPMISLIEMTYSQSNQWMKNTIPIYPTTIPIYLNYVSQVFNDDGWITSLLCKYNDSFIKIDHCPIPPLNIEEYRFGNPALINIRSNVDSFIAQFENVMQINDGYSFSFGNIPATISFIRSDNTVGMIDRFITLEKCSRNKLEHACYLFAKTRNFNFIKMVDEKEMDYSYSPVFTSDQLVIDEKSHQGLIQQISIKLNGNSAYFDELASSPPFAKTFYASEIDFKKRKDCVVIKGKIGAIQHIAKPPVNIYKVQAFITVTDNFFLFSNRYVGNGKIFFAFVLGNRPIFKCAQTLQFVKDNHYVPTLQELQASVNESAIDPFVVYSYKSMIDITKLQVGQALSQDNEDYSFIGYKIRERDHFILLLAPTMIHL